jgi:hypothetical protein
MRHAALLTGLVGNLVTLASIAAPTTIENFDNFTLDAKYANWGAPSAVLTSGPTSYDIQAKGYGSGYKYLGKNIDASSNDTVQLGVTVRSGVAGFVVDISDSNNNGQQYAWYGLVPGGGKNGSNDYVLTMPVASGTFFQGSGVIDQTSISQMNIGIDPGASAAVPYDVSFNDLSFTNAASSPEPATLGLLACGALLMARRRR